MDNELEIWELRYYNDGEFLDKDIVESEKEVRTEINYMLNNHTEIYVGDGVSKLVNAFSIVHIENGVEDEVFSAEFDEETGRWRSDSDVDRWVDNPSAVDVLAYEIVPDHDLVPPEYPDNDKETYDEFIEISFENVGYRITPSRDWEFDDETFEWISDEDDLCGDRFCIGTRSDCADDILYLVEDILPDDNDHHYMSGSVCLVYNIDEDGYATLDTDASEVKSFSVD